MGPQDPEGRQYGAKFPKAVAKILDKEDVLLAFYDYPAEYWIHLQTTNPIESTFATVRLRTRVTRGGVMDTIALLVVDVVHRDLNEAAITARCLARLNIGTTLSDLSGMTLLRVTTIERYPGVHVDTLEPPHAARLSLCGLHADEIQPGDRLVIHDGLQSG